ncbi:hypothetical protein O181_072157 [Austropuccinia psidii MF-1]|uniref:Integrase zinc-binding domain-containing protein n=1 Tax=Austropuccinia psidii MF-1 TaxID=1389203 RepID=A0A9Q3F907_9BASI|nr:hypothetical protein [Austropuccinia psidii MF-1]
MATLPDSWSCWNDMYPERGVDFIRKNTQDFQKALKPDEIQESRLFPIKVEIFSDLVDPIQKELWQDTAYKEVLKKLARCESVSYYSLETQARLLSFRDRVVIPINKEIQLDILQKHHESPLAGHPGQKKTVKLIKKGFLLGWNESNHQGICVLMSATLKKQENSL